MPYSFGELLVVALLAIVLALATTVLTRGGIRDFWRTAVVALVLLAYALFC